MTTEVTGQLVTPAGVFPGRLIMDQRIQRIEPLTEAPAQWILPGVLDWHNHGGGGGDVMDGEVGIRKLARTHAMYGMTGFLATTVTADRDRITEALEATRRVMQDRHPGEAMCYGVHLEGPYLSEAKIGAQPPMTRPLDVDELRAWLELGVIRVITYAPERDPEGALPTLAAAYGVRLQLGHTACPYALAERRLSEGHGVTHLYNAMTGVSHRTPGVALAALNHGTYCEIICDGIHVEAPAFELARRSITHLYGVTDATAASGMPDGEYALGSHRVWKQGETVRLADGTLAGSAATATTSLKTLRAFGVPWDEIGALLSTRPAEWLGLGDAGSIREGARADVLVWNGSSVSAVWVGGEPISIPTY